MIKIEKINSTKRIYHFMIYINGWNFNSRDNLFYRKRDAQKYINQNKKKLENLVSSIEYKEASPFDIPDEMEMLLRSISAIYNKKILENNYIILIQYVPW